MADKEINVKVHSEGGDEVADDIESAEVGAEGGEDKMGDIAENTEQTGSGMMGMLGGIGIMVGLLSALPGLSGMFEGLMKIVKSIFMPFMSMAMKLMGPLIKTIIKYLPKIQNWLATKGGMIVSGISAIAGALAGFAIGGIPGAIVGGLLGALAPIGVSAILNHIFPDWVPVDFLVKTIFPVMGSMYLLSKLFTFVGIGGAGMGPSVFMSSLFAVGAGITALAVLDYLFKPGKPLDLLPEAKTTKQKKGKGLMGLLRGVVFPWSTPSEREVKWALSKGKERKTGRAGGDTYINMSGGLETFVDRVEKNPNVEG